MPANSLSLSSHDSAKLSFGVGSSLPLSDSEDIMILAVFRLLTNPPSLDDTFALRLLLFDPAQHSALTSIRFQGK